MKLGLFKFLKKEEKKEKEVNLPIVLRTENVNEALLKVSSENNIPLSSLDFEILHYETFIKVGDNDFVELDEQTKEVITTEEFLVNEENEIKQVYEIEIKKFEFADDLELIGDIEFNKYFTDVKYIIKPQSLIIYRPQIERRIKNELNKKKVKNSMLIDILDTDMDNDIEKIIAKVRVLGQLEHEETVRLCRGIDPIENIEGKVIYHYLKNRDKKNELLFPVKKDEILIEIVKPIQGRNGRDCRGKIILIPKVREFNIPKINFKSNEIKKEEDERRIVYIALKDGYIYKDGEFYTIKDEMEIKQINIKTGNVRGAKDSNVKLEVKESDALKEAIADNMVVETTELIVRGNVGKSAKINALDLKVHGQTHQKAKIYANKAFINVHKGYVEGKEIEINRLESGMVKGKKVKINQAIGGKVIAEEVEFGIMGSHVEVYALKKIDIKKIKGSENKLIISPLKVLGLDADANKLEKQIEEVERNIEIKTKEYKKRKEILIKNKPTIEQYMKKYKENKQKGIKTSPSVLKKIKEYNEYKDKTLELKSEIMLLKKDLQELKETLQNFQNAIFNAKIIAHSPWPAYNRIEFDMVEPPIKLKYDTKGTEGTCGFKLKDYEDAYKIVKIKVKDDSST
jgi:hypothetical protein